MSDMAQLADLLDSCEPEDDQPITWGSLRRQVRKAAMGAQGCYQCGDWRTDYCNVDGFYYCNLHYPENLR